MNMNMISSCQSQTAAVFYLKTQVGVEEAHPDLIIEICVIESEVLFFIFTRSSSE